MIDFCGVCSINYCTIENVLLFICRLWLWIIILWIYESVFLQDAEIYVAYMIGYPSLSQDVEEGICQVLALMWLNAKLKSGSVSNLASASSSSSSAPKRDTISKFERTLGEFFKHQIESDSSPVYGDGFRAGQRAVSKYGLQETLNHIWRTGSFPHWSLAPQIYFCSFLSAHRDQRLAFPYEIQRPKRVESTL